MVTKNKEITIEEAEQLMNCNKGMVYPNTEHNKKMIAKVTHNILKELQKELLLTIKNR